jgi:hypothetical protein
MLYLELLIEYRAALSLWSEARSIYRLESPEVLAATQRLNALERELNFYKRPALAA